MAAFERMADLVIAAQHIAQAAQAFRHGIKHADVCIKQRLLRHIHDFEAVLDNHLAVVELLHAGEDF